MARGQTRLSRVLLAFCAALLTTTIALAWLLWSQSRSAREIRGRQLAEDRLLEQLAAMTPSDRIVIPHVDPRIGIVFDPAKKRGTWRAADDTGYAINSLGLRGPEIVPPQPQVIRILIVGDSVIFGWRIADADRIGDTIERVVNRRLGRKAVEVISVALPGWNTTSEVAFIRRHLHLLQPDFVVWNLLRNDIVGVPGAVPPGILGRYASPHKRGLEPFRCRSDYQYELPLPSILGRWHANLDLIAEFTNEFRLTGLLLNWMPDTRAHIEHVIRTSGFSLPVTHLPGYYRNHGRWPLNETDSHPTPWATHKIAIGLIGELLARNAIPPMNLEPGEERVVDRWAAENTSVPSLEASNELLRDRLAEVPIVIDPTVPATETGIIFGVTGGVMSGNGLLCLRSDDPVSSLALEIEPVSAIGGEQRTVWLAVRSLSGDEVTTRRPVVGGQASYRIDLPPNADFERVWELEWRFDFADCVGPRNCFSARLIRAQLTTN